MAKFISEEILQQIQSALNIVEVVDEYIRLKKSGRNFKALCPFHTEKTPSFMVSPDKQIYHCFGCGEGGNMFSFVMKYLNVGFPEAAEILANKAGVKIPKKSGYKKDGIIDKFYKINKIVAKYYFTKLCESKDAVKYIKRRGFNKDIIDKFMVGYAKDEWDQILKFMKKKNVSPKLLEKAGLVLSRKNKGWYDRFRDRIIFPIFDINSRIIGFGARALNNSTPKYINSPETKVYSKRKHLYGLNFAKSAIRQKDEVIVVEGYTDVLSLYQRGIKNVVSNLGTALTKEHIRKIKRFTDNVLVIYDADEAGKLASLRNLDLLIEDDMRIKLICLPSGQDPDEYIQKFGKEKFWELIKDAKDLLDYKLHILDYKIKDGDVHRKRKIINDILLTIKKVNDHILQNEYLKRLSQFTDIDETVLRKQLCSMKKNRSFIERRDSVIDATENYVPSAEKLLLRAMLEDESSLALAQQKINVDNIENPVVKKIIKCVFNMKDVIDGDVDLNKIMNHVDDKKASQLLAKIFCEFETMPKHREVLSDCIKSIELDKLNSQLSDLKMKLKSADSKQKKELLFCYSNVCKEITNLKKHTKQ